MLNGPVAVACGTSQMNTKLPFGVLLLGIVLAGCQIDGVQYNGTFPASLVQAAHATPARNRAKQTHHRRTAKAAKPTAHYHRAKTRKPVKAAQLMQTNSAAYGLTLIGEA